MAKKIKVNQKAMKTDDKFFKADRIPHHHLKKLFRKTRPQHNLQIIKIDVDKKPGVPDDDESRSMMPEATGNVKW